MCLTLKLLIHRILTMTISKNKLFNLLTKCADVINKNIEKPNYGGCGVIAVAVAKELKARKIPVEIVTPVYPSTEYVPPKVAVQRVIQWNKQITNDRVDDAGVNRNHLAVRFKIGRLTRTWETDANISLARVFGEDKRYPCPYPFGEGFTIEEAQVLVKDKRGWNPTYDRAQNRKVNKIIKTIFKELSNE
jgi:hypothetical protein